MRSRIGLIVLVGVLGCGGTAPRPAHSPTVALPEPPPIRPGVPPPADEAGLRKLLVGVVTNGGIHFTDPSCQAQFAKAGPVGPAAFDAFAHCMSMLQLHPTGRPDGIDDVSVLADAAGFELEAHVLSGRLDFIGPSGRAPGMPDMPTITPEALEALRVTGDPNATLSDFDGQQLVADMPEHRFVEHQRLCIGERGEITTIVPAATTMPESQIAFSRVTTTWKFRPFVVDGNPIPVCAVVGLQFPASPRHPRRDLLPKPPAISRSGHIVYMVSPMVLEKQRLTGTKFVVPADREKVVVARDMGDGPVIGVFRLCLDERGHYESGTLVQSTRLPGYDARIAHALMQWTFKPYLAGSTPIPVCAMFTFIYTQR